MGVCVLLSFLAATVAFLGLCGSRIWQMIVLLLVYWTVLWNVLGSNYKYQVESLKDQYKHPVSIERAAAAVAARPGEGRARTRLPVEDLAALNGWRQYVTRGVVPPKLAIVVTGGGGLRAACWTDVVLDHLERDSAIGDFDAHLRLVVGVSGGMVGAAHYVVRATPALADRVRSGKRSGVDLGGIPTDCLSPIVRSFVGPDLLGFISVVPVTYDRGLALEQSWPKLDIKLADLADLEAQGQIPSLIFAPVLVDDDRRLLISNLDLAGLFQSQGGPEGKDLNDQDGLRTLAALAGPLEFWRTFPEADGFKLATAARLNATFPYVTPEVDLPTVPPRQVAAATDNDVYGLRLVASWIHRHLAWLLGNTSGVAIVLINVPPDPLFSEFTLLGEMLAERTSDPQFLNIFGFESTLPMNRSWYLPGDEVALLKQGMDFNGLADPSLASIAELTRQLGDIDRLMSDPKTRPRIGSWEDRAQLRTPRDAPHFDSPPK